MKQLRLLEYIKPYVSSLVLMSLVFDVLGASLIQLLLWYPFSAEAAQVTIDNTATLVTDATSNTGSNVVFISDLVGYTFYVDSTNQCVYKKTIDGGNNWGTTVIVDSQLDCTKIVIWYDRWTPGDTTGTYIHISTIDTSFDDMFYNRPFVNLSLKFCSAVLSSSNFSKFIASSKSTHLYSVCSSLMITF